jgi:hypothetical protein
MFRNMPKTIPVNYFMRPEGYSRITGKGEIHKNSQNWDCIRPDNRAFTRNCGLESGLKPAKNA